MPVSRRKRSKRTTRKKNSRSHLFRRTRYNGGDISVKPQKPDKKTDKPTPASKKAVKKSASKKGSKKTSTQKHQHLFYTSVHYNNGKGEKTCVQIDGDSATITTQALPDGKPDVKKVSRDVAMKKLESLRQKDQPLDFPDIFKSSFSPIFDSPGLSPISSISPTAPISPISPVVSPISKAIEI